MIAWLLGLAGAVSDDGAQLWWPLGVEQTASGATVAAVIPADGAFFVSHGASWDCDSLEVWDPVGPVAVRCDPVASATSGDLAILSPDPRWPVGETLDVRAGGTAFTDAFAVLDEDASTDHGAAPDERTVLDSGVSYRICNRGVVGMALRGLEAPGSLGAVTEELVLGLGHFGGAFTADNGLWDDAGPGEEGTFWFASYDAMGNLSDWSQDTVDLVRAGGLRVDLRPGAGGECPTEDDPWILGEVLDAEGGAQPPPAGPPDGSPAQAGCGCQTAPGVGWVWGWVAGLALWRRRT